jgi:hypothetical protein
MSRSGKTINVTVLNSVPASKGVACTQVYGSHEETIALGSDFVSGEEYTAKVNGETLTFTAQ